MEAPRERRLRFELDRMNQLAEENPHIRFHAQGARPIEYQVRLYCRGIESVQDEHIVYRDEHDVLIRLTPEFPLETPIVIWVTPLYHPNVFQKLVCLGDHWYPGWSLAEMCKALYDMALYKTFNIYDPLNKEAAQWLERRIDNGETIALDVLDSADETNFEINATPRSE